MFSVAGPWGTLSHISPISPMIKSKPASLQSNWFHSQLDSQSSRVAYIPVPRELSLVSCYEFTPCTAFTKTRHNMLRIHATERPRGRACSVCSQLNSLSSVGGGGNSFPRLTICVRASSHTAGNRLRKCQWTNAGARSKPAATRRRSH